MIPSGFRIDDRNGAASANAQAVRFGAEDFGFAGGKVQFFETAFEIIPGFQAVGFQATLGGCLVGAEEDMPLDSAKVILFLNIFHHFQVRL